MAPGANGGLSPEHRRELCRLALAYFHLWLLQRQAALLTPAGATAAVRDGVMLMLEVAASQAAALAEGGCDMAAFEVACFTARRQLEAAVAERERQAAAAAMLPPLSAVQAVCSPGSYCCPRGMVPAPVEVRQERDGLGAARERAFANLGSLPLVQRSQDSAAWMKDLVAALQLAQARAPAAGADVAAQHAVSMVEHELFGCAASADIITSRGAALGPEGLEALVQAVDTYRAGTELAAAALHCLFCVAPQPRQLHIIPSPAASP